MTYIKHYGTLRRSGRYPWGSGNNAQQRHTNFLGLVDSLRKKGLSDIQIARGMNMNSTQFRAANAISKNEIRKANEATALRLKDKGMSTSAIGRKMQRNESSVRDLLDPAAKARADILVTTANMVRDRVAEVKYLDVGEGTEHQIGVSATRLKTAVAMLVHEGYTLHSFKEPQLGTIHDTRHKILLAPGTTYSELLQNKHLVKSFQDYTEDGGRTYKRVQPPAIIDSKRIGVRYRDEGGNKKDGVIELRRGVDDLSLGQARYAQVRIAVDGTHYLKGMAMYSDNMPKGVDLLFNTNKTSTGNHLDAMKPIATDPDSPFGSVIRQKHYIDKNGKMHLSPLNIVGSPDPLSPGKETRGEEGGWREWSHDLSSQMLSKQLPPFAKERLAETVAIKKAEYDEISKLTNPTIRKKLLEKFADGADASSVHLQAASLPRTFNHVILPINSLKDNEVYAPFYRNGEKVVLIRHPHGGIFEIPELTVNNRNKEANGVIKQAIDAVGINSKVAARLSGADFDGDTVLVIPNRTPTNARPIVNSAPLRGLKDFDPSISYKGFEGMKVMKDTQGEMGRISNLITDMTIQGAPSTEIARAVRHSMVVIDAEKKSLNYKQSALDNGISQLKARYQGKDQGKTTAGGASTIISRSSAQKRVPERKPRLAIDGGPVDKLTGEKRFTPTGRTYTDKNGRVHPSMVKSKQMAETSDARTLLSSHPRPIEVIYANHANTLKAIANAARKSALETPNLTYSPSANKIYKAQADSLKAKLNLALKNKPLERQAQILGNTKLKAKRQANPDLTAKDIKKIKGQALIEARDRAHAKKVLIEITPDEWTAIQAGAISNNFLSQILNNTDIDKVKQLATPRATLEVAGPKLARAKSMLAAGFTQSEIADALGVPASTLNDALHR